MGRFACSIATAALLLSTLGGCRAKEAEIAGGVPAPAAAAGSTAPAADGSAPAPAPATAGAAPAPEVPSLPVHPSDFGGGVPGQPASAPAAGSPAPAARIAFSLPTGWTSKAPASSMRLAEATISGPGGPAELALFYFGPGQGGGVEENIARWNDQVAGGTPKRGTLTAGGLKVSWLDVSGTMKATAMGMGPKTEQAGYRLLGAVVEGPGGPWFFKATGPETTLGPQHDAFLDMLKSVHLQSGQSA